jgi:hypothetical protein
MFGIPLDTLLGWVNVIYLSALGIAAAATFAIYQLSARMNAAKDRELQRFQIEAGSQIEAARENTAQASARTAELLKANTELQLELQQEKDARTAMLEQLQARDMTKEQIAQFVETIKGKVRQLSVFTIPDSEASIYGVTVLDALQKAGVSVTWYRMQSPVIMIEGVNSTGVTIYQDQPGGSEGAGEALLKAFVDMHIQSNLLTPVQPLQGVPSPSLFIALKPPSFIKSPDPLRPPEIETHRLPWGSD